MQLQAERARQGFEHGLALAPVAMQLEASAKQALPEPKVADGRMINALESLKPSISSPLIAYRYQKVSE